MERPVPKAYEGVLAEDDRLAPGYGRRESNSNRYFTNCFCEKLCLLLGKDDSSHARLDDNTEDALDAHGDHGGRALLGGGSAISNKNGCYAVGIEVHSKTGDRKSFAVDTLM